MRTATDILNLGFKDYAETYDIQKNFVKDRQQNRIPDTLILVEHPPVFTIGKRGSRENILVSEEKLLKEKIKIYETDRGGDITYHGPGQIVGYPIIDLKSYDRDIHLYLRNIEEVIIKLLETLGIKARRIKGMTGVWVGGKKIASIGIGVSKWVAYHGFCININPNMAHFSMINPCGLNKPVTSVEKQLQGKMPGREKIEEHLICLFTDIFVKSNFIQYETCSIPA